MFLAGYLLIRLLSCGVCVKRLCSLTATDYFFRLHLERSTPVMIFQTMSTAYDKFPLFSVDWSSKKRKQLIREVQSWKIESPPSKRCLVFSGSCKGLFIFRRGGPIYDIVNPITQQQVVTFNRGLIVVGFFFHSRTNKYQLLTYCPRAMDEFTFYVQSLGPSTTRREVGSFPYGPRPRERVRPPVSPPVVNGCLHWMVRRKVDILSPPPCAHSVMVFGIEDYEFRLLPHPGKVNESCQGHENMDLLVTKGHLYAYGMHANILDVWVLEDSANWCWVKKFSIPFERDLEHYSIGGISIMPYTETYRMKLIDIWMDEVLLAVPRKGFFRYHMRLKTITEAQFPHLPIKRRRGDAFRYSHTQMFNDEVIAIESTMSFVTKRDFSG